MASTVNRSVVYLATLLRGAALVVIVLWSVLSFAPVSQILFRDLSAFALTIQALFFATGVTGALVLYGVLLFVATDKTRRILQPSSRRALDGIGLYAAAWLLLYIAVG